MHSMMRTSWAVAFIVLPLTTACSSDSGSGASAQLSKEICEMQISCDYQLSDQPTCEQLFVQFFDPSRLEACHDCLERNQDCMTQQDACSAACSL